MKPTLLAHLSGAFLLTFCSTFAAEQTEGAEQAAAKPNILFIFADDWGWGDLGCHGHPYLKTPNLDRLAKEGTDFMRFTVASGVCSPSRTAVMTGHFPARFNIDGHFATVRSNEKRGMPDWVDPKAPTIPRMLQSTGYATAHFGKWHLANNMIPDSPRPEAYGYDECGAFNCSGTQMPVHEDAKRTIAFIEKNAAAKKPFFINLWMHEPHTPFHTLPEYRKRFPKMGDSENAYAAVLSHADDRIGEVLAALDRLQLTDNTLVIFSSDNGPAGSGKPRPLKEMYDSATGAGFNTGACVGTTGGRNGRKKSILQGGIGVPFIARWPGQIKADAIDDVSWISAVDLLPTFCEIAGAAMPEGYRPDGKSQLATLRGTELTLRDKPLFWKGLPSPKGPVYSVLDGQWRLLASTRFEVLELFDVNSDPLEKNNLASSHPDVADGLLKKLQAWHATLPEKPNSDWFSKYRARDAGPLPPEVKPVFQFDPSR
ncbi:sulfatase [Planctomycetes bacterium K23_9]|uniref:Arylsulfatase n=1 Tax=Stieleria marina TaxID=1930275 RepID=A0A517NMC7_9BACT|nr:Arylsulfatase [Planctomycetes bacterium K23_9]